MDGCVGGAIALGGDATAGAGLVLETAGGVALGAGDGVAGNGGGRRGVPPGADTPGIEIPGSEKPEGGAGLGGGRGGGGGR